MESTKVADGDYQTRMTKVDAENLAKNIAAEKTMGYASQDELEQIIKDTKKQMEKAAKELDFIEAARLRDLVFEYQKAQKK
jgi:excinuclease ABC subunit B